MILQSRPRAEVTLVWLETNQAMEEEKEEEVVVVVVVVVAVVVSSAERRVIGPVVSGVLALALSTFVG